MLSEAEELELLELEKARATAATAEPPQTFHTNAAEGFSVGGLQGMTMGFADELAGALQHPTGAVKKLFGGDESDQDVKNYLRERDTAREAFKATEAQNPNAALAGEVTGSVLTSALPVANAAALPSVGARLAAAGVQGAVEGYGRSDADDLAGQAKDVAIGAGGSVAGQGLSEVGGAILKRLRGKGLNPENLPAIPGESVGSVPNPAQGAIDKLDDFAEKRAVKQGGAMLKDFRALDHKGRLNETGRAMLDHGVVTPLSSLEDVAKRSGALMEEHGKKLVAVENAIDSRFDDIARSDLRDALVTPQKLAEKMDGFLDELRADPVLADLVGPLETKVNAFRAMGDEPITFAEARKLKGSFDKLLDWDKQGTPGKELIKKLRGILNGEIEGGVEAIASRTSRPETFADWKNSKKMFGMMKDVKEMAEDQLFRADANRYISPSDYMTAIGGGIAGTSASEGDPLTGSLSAVAMGSLNRFGRKYGSSLAATGANKLARTLEKGVPKALDVASTIAERTSSSLLPGRAGGAAARATFADESSPDHVIERLSSSPEGQRWLPQIQQAHQRGGNAFAVTNYMLSQQYPEYRELTKGKKP